MVVILLLVPSSSSASLTTPTFTTSISTAPAKCFLTNSQSRQHNDYLPPRPPLPKNYHASFLSSPSSKSNQNSNKNYTREYVNHITRINISNDFPQAESNKDQQDAIVKEGEILFEYQN